MKINNIKLIIVILVVAAVVGGSLYWYLAIYRKLDNLVVINNCSDINPRKLDIVEGMDIIFKNKDKSDHNLTIGGGIIKIPAGEKVVVKAEFPYGAATYSYDCDNSLNVAELNITSNISTAVVAEPVKPIFNEWYDNLSLSLRTCIKDALGEEFNEAYSDPEYEISVEAVEKMRNCKDEPTKEDVTFKEYYDSQGKGLQECLKNGLGDEFDKLYEDTKAELSVEHSNNMVDCFNNY